MQNRFCKKYVNVIYFIETNIWNTLYFPKSSQTCTFIMWSVYIHSDIRYSYSRMYFLVTLILTGTDHTGLTDVAQGPLCCPTSQINSPPLVNTRSSDEHSGVTNFVALLTWIGSLLLLGLFGILLHRTMLWKNYKVFKILPFWDYFTSNMSKKYTHIVFSLHVSLKLYIPVCMLMKISQNKLFIE